jgi:hypothetical protein
MTATVSPPPLPEAPYRGLEPYLFCDQAIFFEREVEAERLIRQVTRYRASLLYGESGVGKSSLINAGLIPKALAEGMAVERLRVQPQPGQEFVVERIPRSAKEDEFLPSILIRGGEPHRTALSAEEFNTRLSNATGATILVIFDQFEELLTLSAEAAAAHTLESQNRILNTIVTLIQDRKNTNLRLLFVFREDYLAKFERFFYFCPELPDRFLRLTPPPASALPRVLRGPFESAQIPPGYWRRTIPESVAMALEQQLRPAEEGTAINLSKVQIVALQVWRSADPAKEFAGRGVDELVSDYLRDQLNRFRDERGVAESLLSLMITRQGTRRVISEGEVLDEAGRQDGVSPDRARGVLERLVTETRLVRRDHHRGTTTYEIVSEFLVPWIRPLKLQREARKARNLWLRRAVAIVVVIGAVLGGIFYWKYTTTTVEALRTNFVRAAQAAAAQAQQRETEAQARAQQAEQRVAQLNQRLLELQALIKNQTSEREKKLLDDLNGKAQELTHEQAQNRELIQQLEKLRRESARAALDLDSEKKRRAAEVAALRKQINALNVPETAPPAETKNREDTASEPAAPAVSQVGILALRHDHDVKSAAFSADGRRLVTISSTAAYVWDAETGALVGKPLMHPKDVKFAAFSPDGKEIVTIDSNETRVWNAETGAPFTGPITLRKLYSAAINPSGYLVTATSEEVLRFLTPLPSLQPEHLIQWNVSSAVFSPDGLRVLAFYGKSAQVWSVESAKEGKQRIGPALPSKSLYDRAAFSLDGRHLVMTTSDKTAQVYEVETGKPEGQPLTHKNYIHSVALDGAGHRVVTTSIAEAHIWDAATGKRLGASVPRAGLIYSAALSPDGRRLVSCSGKIAHVYVVASN